MSDRTPVNDALTYMGKILDGTDAARDAVHVAVERMTAGHSMDAGTQVSISHIDGTVYETPYDHEAVGIIDPFLFDGVREGQECFVMLMPGTVTSLRHVWTHPSFDDVPDTPPEPAETKIEAERWIKAWLEDHGDNPGFDAVMAVVEHGSWSDGDSEWPATGQMESFYDDDLYIFFHDADAHGDIPPEFWDHASVYLGRTIPDDERATAFSCTC